MKRFYRVIPLLLIVILFFIAYKLQLTDHLNFANLKKHYLQLANYVDLHFGLSVFIFCLIYILVVVTSIPGATILSLLGGFLFGSILGTVLAITCATIGATLLFLAVKIALGEIVSNKIGNQVRFFKKNLEANSLYYLLSLRLLPIFPFFLINLACGIVNISLRNFVIATFFGIIPGTFVYVNIGSSLNSVFEQSSNTFQISSLISPQIIIALVLVGILSLIPVIIKSRKVNNNG